MSIGENIRSIRTQKKLTQEELAKKIGVARPMIAQIERGTKSITLELGVEMAQALDCTLEDFLSEGQVVKQQQQEREVTK